MDIHHYFNSLYHHFNKREIDDVIACMGPDIKWANGMDGGYVFGHEGVRQYWKRQFTLVNSQVTPIRISETGDSVIILVHQVVHDLKGTLLADAHVSHIFRLKGDKIESFEIGDPI